VARLARSGANPVNRGSRAEGVPVWAGGWGIAASELWAELQRTSAYSQEIAGEMSHPQIRSFIRKPFKFDDLLKTLRSCLSS